MSLTTRERGAYIRVGFTRVEKCVTNLGAFIRGSLYTEFCGILIVLLHELCFHFVIGTQI